MQSTSRSGRLVDADSVPGLDETNTDEGGFLLWLQEPLPSLTETPSPQHADGHR